MIVQEKIDAVDLEVKNETSNVNSYNTKEPAKRKGDHLIDAYYENSRNRTFRPISATALPTVLTTNVAVVEAATTALLPTPLLSPLAPVNLLQRHSTDENADNEPLTTSASGRNSSSSSSLTL